MRRSATFRRRSRRSQAYDAIMLSDLGSNTLLLHPDTWIHSKTTPNRLAAAARLCARRAAALLMFGGYYSFQGINGGARYHKTPVEEVLPVTCLAGRRPRRGAGGLRAGRRRARRAIRSCKGLGTDWPILLGFNEVTVKDGAEVLATVSSEYGSLPLLVTGRYGKGRTCGLDIRCRAALAAAGVHRLEGL